MEPNQIKYLNDPTKTIDFLYVVLTTGTDKWNQTETDRCYGYKTTYAEAYELAHNTLCSQYPKDDFSYAMIQRINCQTAQIVDTYTFTKKDTKCE